MWPESFQNLDAEYEGLKGFLLKHPVITTFVVIVLIVIVVAKVKSWQTAKLKEDLATKDAEIAKLRDQLNPFLTVAVGRYTGTPDEALKKLWERISKLELLFDYTDISKIEWSGISMLSEGVGVGHPIAWQLQGLVEKKGDRITWEQSEAAEKRYQQVIDTYPCYPFAFYYLASSLKTRGDARWRGVASKAKDITEKTVQIRGHDSSHDNLLAELVTLLAEEDKKKGTQQ